jgi:hypothetical protein
VADEQSELSIVEVSLEEGAQRYADHVVEGAPLWPGTALSEALLEATAEALASSKTWSSSRRCPRAAPKAP